MEHTLHTHLMAVAIMVAFAISSHALAENVSINNSQTYVNTGSLLQGK